MPADDRRDRQVRPRRHLLSPRAVPTAGRTALVVALTLLAGAVVAPSAQAFGTVWGILGQHSEHERVTRLALQCGAGVQPPECFQPASLDNLAGKRGSFGAVGAPDNIPLHLHRDRDYWHCDNSDYLVPALHGLQAYGQGYYVAMRRLYECIQWGRDKLYGTRVIGDNDFPPATPDWGAVPAARDLVSRGRADTANPGTGIFSPTCVFNGVRSGRPKCRVLEPFGYVLHMAEDFYSHTNWADHQDPARRLSPENPIGLDRHDLAPFLDLRVGYRDNVPDNFTGSCYPKKACGHDRVIHGESNRDLGLNKDKGLIDLRTGRTTEPGTPRGRIFVEGATNFQRAVSMAAREARRQWSVFRQALVDEYGEARAAQQICVLTIDYAEHCDRPTVVLAVGTGAEARAGGRARAAATGDDAAEVTAGRQVLERLGRGARVAVVTFDHASGVQDVDPFVAPAAARIDDALAGDAAADPPVDREIGRERDLDDDPTITPIADPAAPGNRPDDGYTHGSEEGGERHDEEESAADEADHAHGVDDRPAPTSEQLAATASLMRSRPVEVPPATPAQREAPAPPAETAAVHPAAAADALRSARRLLDAADAPRGQQGIALIADDLGDQRLLLDQLHALRKDRVRVSIAVHSPRALTARVLRAIEATGGTAMVSHDDGELAQFGRVVDGAGVTRLGDAFAHRKSSLQRGAPGILGVTARGRDLHAVRTLRRPGRLLLRSFDGPLTMLVRDSGSGARRSVRVTPRRPMTVPLRAGRSYELLVAGPGERRYEAEVTR
ncbi:hypothetical protein VSS74_21625 [Conexibacter stalactiti]|uniref:VWFA domain-containing protein n=1 Tax=Conexibacter stalactiti TaxID=1940611 RepID=A0ABU4HWA9_9ACTN|nr:hypothetical protein [Conexibacter stalactiti]MDW5596962.1 hypothetical protein [Conexibacter stalactiti]MEC5037604.1 hypothetical protein [Conexibacter stalactiti]